MSHYLQMAAIHQPLNSDIQQRAEQLEQQGLKALDALHVASAEAAKSDSLITCDKRFINRCQGLTIKVINPVDFIEEIEDDN